MDPSGLFYLQTRLGLVKYNMLSFIQRKIIVDLNHDSSNKMYRSQLKQDEKVLTEFFPAGHKGFFVEAGAVDGLEWSNTKALEEAGWTGLCVEPSREFAELVVNRNCHKAKELLWSVSGVELEFCDDQRGTKGELSGITSELNNLSFGPPKGDHVVFVSVTLPELLDRIQAPEVVDYLSLDTEGSELEILKGFVNSRYTFRVLSVEHNFKEPARTDIRQLLEANGYKYHGPNQWDDWYVRE